MRRLLAGILLAVFLLLGCQFFPESTFELAPASRLPRWFSLPRGLTRSDVTVTLNYYVKAGGRTATFILRGPNKEKLAEVSGSEKGLQPIELKKRLPGYAPGYPLYEIITVKDITEVIEHRRMEPIFYVSDNSAVLTELGISRPK